MALGLHLGPKQPKGMIKETRRVVALARKFNDEVARPLSLDLDRRTFTDHDELPWGLVEKCNEWGLFTAFVPKVFGGKGYNLPSLSYFNEEVGSVCLGIANVISVHNLGVACLTVTGNTRVARRVLNEVRHGEKTGVPCLISVSLTEPTAGTDMQDLDLIDRGSIGCRATRVDGGYIVNGTKVFTSSGHLSTWDVLYTCTDPKRPAETMVVLAVRKGTKGFSLGRFEEKLGQRICPASTLQFEDCFVPDDLVLMDARSIATFSDASAQDIYRRHFDFWLCMSRGAIGAWGTAAARGAYEAALSYADETVLDGKPMINHEWVQCRLAEMYANVRLSRLAYLEATQANPLYNLLQSKHVYYTLKHLPAQVFNVLGPLLDKPAASRLTSKFLLHRDIDQSLCVGLSSMAKFAGGELAIKNCQMALELMGANGLRHEQRVEKILRDAKLLQIYEGTAQLNRLDTFKTVIAPASLQAKVFVD
jgi:alkylation response protein AidB-like acyl-CoA dehydrogenase